MFSANVLKGIANAKAYLDKQSKAATSRFAVVDSEGTVHPGNDVCHGRLASINPASGATREVVVTATNQEMHSTRGNNTPALIDAYAAYLTQHSVFADCFLGVEDGYYLVDCHKPANKMAAACVATRAGWERYSGVAKIILDLVDAGVHPSLAIFMGNACTIASQAKEIAWSRSEEDHHCLESNYFSFKDLANLINNQPQFVLPLYSVNNTYRGINKLFLCPDGAREPTWVKNQGPQAWMTENLVPEKAAPVKNTNPFPVVVPPVPASQRKFITYKAAVKLAIDAAPTLMEKALS